MVAGIATARPLSDTAIMAHLCSTTGELGADYPVNVWWAESRAISDVVFELSIRQ